MADKKGIRVNALAKELGVESKLVLQKLRDEGLGDKVPNHMTVISVGLAESVREWFSGGGGVATAVEVAPPPPVKTKRAPSRKKKAADAPAEHEGEEPHEAHGEPHDEHVHDEHVPHEPVAEPVAPEAEAPIVEEPAAVPEPVAPEAPPAAAAEAQAPPEAPESGEGDTRAAATRPGQVGPDGQRVARPTVTLGSTRDSSIRAQRPQVIPAPQLTRDMLKPAAIQGPKIIRVEKAEPVAAPRPRGPRGPSDDAGPGYTTARPTTGRGVRVTEDDEEAAKKAAAKKSASLSGRRRSGNEGRRGMADEKLREYTEADLIERKERLHNAGKYVYGVGQHMGKAQRAGTHALAKTGVQRGEPIQLEEPITVRNLSAALGIKSNDLMRKLMRQGVMATINQSLDQSIAESLAMEYGIELQIKQRETLAETLVRSFDERERDPNKFVPRPPVVTILGHVDHGKTSLLDKIRHANVAAGEAGGITQHTAAWMVEVGEGDSRKRVTFIDTPGHQAFTSMRARGASVTDVVVLVVAAVEGVMPQTIESINHARAAKVPIVVAMNKIDRPDANPDMVLGQLAKEGLNPVEWGGDIEVIRTSAVTGQGISDLIEILDLQTQILELKADPDAPARGTVIEARVDPGLGSVATVLVQEGTLRVGDVILAGPGYGRVRSLLNDRGESLREAGPSVPVVISGLNAVPGAGDKFYFVGDMDQSRAIAEERQTLSRQKELAARNQAAGASADSIFAQMKQGQVKTINLIIKADVAGSVETLVKTVTDYNTEEVRIRVIHSAVGAINESDVELAAATKDVNESTVIVGFHVIADEAARAKAEHMHVEIRTYQVIYEIFDDLKKALSGMLEPEVREKLHGHAEVRQVFRVSKLGNIGGCFVRDGHISRGSKIRLVREGTIITQDLSIESLKRLKDDVKEVKTGLECGIKLAGYDDIKVGDVLEAYIRETFQRTL